jgi:hypothetical protein
VSTATIAKIYDLLFTGNKVQLKFPHKDAATHFRKRLQTHKHRIELELKQLEQIEHLSLSMHFDPDNCVATFKIAEHESEAATFEILNIIPPPYA